MRGVLAAGLVCACVLVIVFILFRTFLVMRIWCFVAPLVVGAMQVPVAGVKVGGLFSRRMKAMIAPSGKQIGPFFCPTEPRVDCSSEPHFWTYAEIKAALVGHRPAMRMPSNFNSMLVELVPAGYEKRKSAPTRRVPAVMTP